jgi:signal transduction histidine kinase
MMVSVLQQRASAFKQGGPCMAGKVRAHRAPVAFAIYAVGLTALVVGIVIVLLGSDGAAVTGPILALVVWGAVLMGVDLLPVPAWNGVQLLMDFPVLIALAIIYDPVAAALVVFVASVDPREIKRQIGPVRALFNRSQLAASALVASAVYHWLISGVPDIGALGAATGAILAGYAVNAGLVGIGASLLFDRPLGEVLRELTVGRASHFLINYVALGFLGVAVAKLYTMIGWWPVAALLIPLMFARQAFARAIALDSAHQELTVSYAEQEARLAESQRLQREKSDLTRVLTHDFLNSVGALRNSATVLSRHWEALSDDRRADMVGWIERETGRITDLTEQMITLMVMDTDDPRLMLRPVSAVELIRQAADSVQDAGGRLKVRVEDAAFGARVFADEGRIIQVLRNLLRNAEKYSEPDTPIELAVDATADVVIWSVKDEGQGISRDEQNRLFERFSRLPGAIASGAPGSGLGLYISRRIVEAHGGSIWVESEPGLGSVFRFALPRSQGE